MLAGGVLPPLSPDGREIPRRHRLGPSRERTMDRARIPARGCGGMARSPRYNRSQQVARIVSPGPPAHLGESRRRSKTLVLCGTLQSRDPGRGFAVSQGARLHDCVHSAARRGWARVPCASMKCVPIPLTRSTGCVRRWTRWGDAPSRITRLVSHRQGRTAGNRGWSKSFPFRFPENGVSSPPTRPCLLL
jgi:hypothetical protein